MRTKDSRAPSGLTTGSFPKSSVSSVGERTQTTLIEASGLRVVLGRHTLLKPTDFTLDFGQWKAVIGPNGAGKSTLLKALATLLPSEGRLTYLGHDVRTHGKVYRRGMGVVLHESLLYQELTAAENLMLFAKLYALNDAQQNIEHRLEQVGLARVAHEPVRRFSRGMLQRLSLARALLHRPHFLLLDEPLTGIDERGAEAMLALFAQARDEGVAALWVTHRWQRAWPIVDEVWEIDRGFLARRTRTAEASLETWTPLHAVVSHAT